MENGAPGRVATYALPGLCIVSPDNDVGAADRTAIGATKAVEEAIRVAAAPRNICVATMLLGVVEVEKNAYARVELCGVWAVGFVIMNQKPDGVIFQLKGLRRRDQQPAPPPTIKKKTQKQIPKFKNRESVF